VAVQAPAVPLPELLEQQGRRALRALEPIAKLPSLGSLALTLWLLSSCFLNMQLTFIAISEPFYFQFLV
jgi:hypothetical protein